MARTPQEIYNSIAAEKENFVNLQPLAPTGDDFDTLADDINSGSKVANWRLMVWVVSIGMWLQEVLWDSYKKDVEAIRDSAQAGTARWYQEQALAFQYGHQLDYINKKYQYAVDDPDARIIERAAVTDLGNQVTIKVAKLSGGTPVPLATAEKNAFQSYLNKIKFAGTNTLIVSIDPDDLKLTWNIYYDPIISKATVQANVETAIEDYIANIVFDGEFSIIQCIDAIQAVEGVTDVKATTSEGKTGAQAYTSFDRVYASVAGHMVIDAANPLSSTLTYVADV